MKASPLPKKITISGAMQLSTVDFSIVCDMLRLIMKKTGAPTLEDAMNLAWFVDEISRDRRLMEQLRLLVDVLRCQMDGNVVPNVDFQNIYQKMYLLDKQKKRKIRHE